MENLHVIAACMMYEEKEREIIDDPYEAVDWLANMPGDYYPRAAFFKIVSVPVAVREYVYLLGWLDATPPHIHHFAELLPSAIEPQLLGRMRAGEVVGYRPVRHGDFWALAEIA